MKYLNLSLFTDKVHFMDEKWKALKKPIGVEWDNSISSFVTGFFKKIKNTTDDIETFPTDKETKTASEKKDNAKEVVNNLSDFKWRISIINKKRKLNKENLVLIDTYDQIWKILGSLGLVSEVKYPFKRKDIGIISDNFKYANIIFWKLLEDCDEIKNYVAYLDNKIKKFEDKQETKKRDGNVSNEKKEVVIVKSKLEKRGGIITTIKWYIKPVQERIKNIGFKKLESNDRESFLEMKSKIDGLLGEGVKSNPANNKDIAEFNKSYKKIKKTFGKLIENCPKDKKFVKYLKERIEEFEDKTGSVKRLVDEEIFATSVESVDEEIFTIQEVQSKLISIKDSILRIANIDFDILDDDKAKDLKDIKAEIKTFSEYIFSQETRNILDIKSVNNQQATDFVNVQYRKIEQKIKEWTSSNYSLMGLFRNLSEKTKYFENERLKKQQENLKLLEDFIKDFEERVLKIDSNLLIDEDRSNLTSIKDSISNILNPIKESGYTNIDENKHSDIENLNKKYNEARDLFDSFMYNDYKTAVSWFENNILAKNYLQDIQNPNQFEWLDDFLWRINKCNNESLKPVKDKLLEINKLKNDILKIPYVSSENEDVIVSNYEKIEKIIDTISQDKWKDFFEYSKDLINNVELEWVREKQEDMNNFNINPLENLIKRLENIDSDNLEDDSVKSLNDLSGEIWKIINLKQEIIDSKNAKEISEKYDKISGVIGNIFKANKENSERFKESFKKCKEDIIDNNFLSTDESENKIKNIFDNWLLKGKKKDVNKKEVENSNVQKENCDESNFFDEYFSDKVFHLEVRSLRKRMDILKNKGSIFKEEIQQLLQAFIEIPPQEYKEIEHEISKLEVLYEIELMAKKYKKWFFGKDDVSRDDIESMHEKRFLIKSLDQKYILEISKKYERKTSFFTWNNVFIEKLNDLYFWGSNKIVS